MGTTLEAAVSAATEALGARGDVIGDGGAEPRFELFHAANSICSQKVRTVLAHHATPYRSHTMNIFAGQTYFPSHVRLRMMGCRHLGLPLVTTHTGSTSVSGGGCDPAVVPTLVDWQAGEVMVDSKRICNYLDSLVDEPRRLRPARLVAAIDAEIDVIDHLPNYQMLAGRPPGEDTRPATRRGRDGSEFAREKVTRCETYMADFAGDETLVQAYAAKRSKEAQAAAQLFTASAMQSAYDKAAGACATFARTLDSLSTPWLFGAEPSMADLLWGVELLRIRNMGAAALWEERGLHSIERYLGQAEQLPSLRTAVIEWPGALY